MGKTMFMDSLKYLSMQTRSHWEFYGEFKYICIYDGEGEGVRTLLTFTDKGGKG